jgi:NAD-dependent dihydropyrimidine dehydrogenase PreA subunit
MGTYLKNVVTLGLDLGKCIGCGMCTEVCPHAVFFIREGKARIRDRDACMECGACARNCPVEAITVLAGVGCAQAILRSWTTGKTACGCDASSC